MAETITLTLTDKEVRAIRDRADEIASAAVHNDKWDRTEELAATRDQIRGNTGASVAYLIQREIEDSSPETNEYGERY